MFIRAMRAKEVPKIEAIYAQARAKYDVPLLDGPNIDAALVAVDENDEPRVLLAAERVVELFLVMDHAWETPAIRKIALESLAKEMRRRLEDKGYRVGYAFLGDDIPSSYDRRLWILGATRMVARCLQFMRGRG